MNAYILIVVALSRTYYGHTHTSVTMQEFANVSTCRAAAEEVKRLNNDHSELRMSCVPKGNP